MHKFRADFPYLSKHSDYIYFDAAATTQKPQVVIDSLNQFYTHDYASVHRGIYKKAIEATEHYEKVRRKLQKFINAKDPEEILFTRGTTASLNLVARCYAKAFLKSGDIVLISATEHHSNIVPWQLLEKDSGIKLKVIPVDENGKLILEEYESLLQENVKLVSVAHISNVIGTIRPVKMMVDMAHKAGAKVCVDGAQAAGHMPLDMQDLGADFYAFSSHKMYGPTGCGILYGKRELLEMMPPYEGGGDMIEKVSFEGTTFAKPPFRFEAGTPMIAEVIGLGAAIDYLNHVGLDQILQWEENLGSYAFNRLSEIEGIRILGSKQRAPIISFVIDGIHPLDVGTFLDCRQIALRSGHHCSQPTMSLFGIESSLRISFALYNTKEEIDRFIFELRQIISSLTNHIA